MLKNLASLAMILSVLTGISYSQSQQGILSVVPGLSLDQRTSLGIGHHLSYGFSILFAPSDAFRFGLSGRFANPTIDYDFVGMTRSEKLRLRTYQIVVASPIHQFAGGVDVEAIFGAGIVTVSSSEQAVSAGGIGFVEIPERSERSNLYSVGLMVTKDLGPHISVTLSPRAVFISPVQISSVGYSIEGGISIGFF